jgi:hypothetical protein
MTFGVPRLNPTEYARQDYDLVPTVTFPRAPLSSDVNFQVQTIWRVGQNPSTGVYGDQWILVTKTGVQSAQVATWRQFAFSTGGGDVNSVSGDDGLVVIPNAGNISFTGQIVNSGTNMHGAVTFVKATTTQEALQVQVASEAASSSKTNAGLASFNEDDFDVDANGFVSAVPQSLASNGLWDVNAGINDVTGDGTQYQIIYNRLVYQNGADITLDMSTGTFTVQTDGVYQFGWLINLVGFSDGGGVAFDDFQASIGDFAAIWDNPGAHYDADTDDGLTYFVGCQESLHATNTIACIVAVGGGSKTISLNGVGGTRRNYFYYNKIQ